MKHLKIIVAILIACLWSSAAMAQELVYEPVNPSFGGNSFNSAHLLSIANAQNDYDPPVVESTSQSELDRFVRSLQSRLLSSLSTQVANAIFGENAQDSGTIIFGDQTISFENTLDGIVLTITEGDGSVTVITIPKFTSSADAAAASGLDSSSLTASNTSSGQISGTPSLLSPIDTPIQ